MLCYFCGTVSANKLTPAALVRQTNSSSGSEMNESVKQGFGKPAITRSD
jgi:hypothetical protein